MGNLLRGMLNLNRVFKSALALFVSAILMLAGGAGLQAHDDSMPGNGRVPAHARDNMRAFASEHHHNQQLSAQSILPVWAGLPERTPAVM